LKKLICLFLGFALLLCGCGAQTEEDAPNAFVPEYPTQSATEPAGEAEILAYRRDVVEKAMREQSAILWRPAEDITYSLVHSSAGLEADMQTEPDRIVRLYADRIYQGIPYSHGSGSYYSWLSFATEQDENGVYTLTGITSQHLNGRSANRENIRARVGNDCADQLFWAWARVSNTISFTYTFEMTEIYGCRKVGDYTYSGTKFSAENNTKNIVKENGQQRMFAAYAQLQKGDGLVTMTLSGEGHAVMVVSSSPVYKADGTIDGEKSKVILLEQTSGNEVNEDYYYNEALGQNVYLCEAVDKEKTYNSIFQSGYLPVTCQELVEPTPRPEPQVTDYTDHPAPDNMFRGRITATYRISSVTVTISREGRLVQEATCFGSQDEMYTMDPFRFTSEVEAPVLQGSVSVKDLPPGTYTCIFTARLATGDNIEFRNFTFTK
jgi:hypothetical protein